MSRGVSVRIFLADGSADGLRVVEKSNWTGIALMCSRAQYPSVQHRKEFDGPGVYVLVGPSQNAGQQTIYVGQADVARTRIGQHARTRDFWTHLILFSSKDANLNKAHVQYLESRLIALATEAKRVAMENGNVPTLPQLAEADRADVESFLEDMLLIYPLLGVAAFSIATQPKDSTGQTLYLKGKDALATGADTLQGFVVFAGSMARENAVGSIHDYMSEIREDLRRSGVLILENNQLKLVQDYLFNSPSTAAGVFLGRTANGRAEWKDSNGRTLKSIQEAALGPVTSTDT